MKLLSHEEAKKESMKDWRYRFWYYILWPKYALIKLWIKIKAKMK